MTFPVERGRDRDHRKKQLDAKLNELGDRGFFGKVTAVFERGVVKRWIVEESFEPAPPAHGTPN